MILTDTPDGRIAYDSDGLGSAVVLAHSDLMDRRMWRAQVKALSGRYRVIGWDRFSCGESDPGPTGPAGTDLWALLDALDVHRAVLVGSSMGAGHCLDAALRQPDRVQGLVLVCPGLPGYVWPPQMREEALPFLLAAVPADRLARYAQGRADPSEADVQAMARAQVGYFGIGQRTEKDLTRGPWPDMVRLAADTFRREWSDPPPASREMPDPPILQRLQQISTPTLVVDGVVDVRFVRELTAQIAAGIPKAQLITMADTGHLPPMEHPEQFNQILGDFLDRLELPAD